MKTLAREGRVVVGSLALFFAFVAIISCQVRHEPVPNNREYVRCLIEVNSSNEEKRRVAEDILRQQSAFGLPVLLQMLRTGNEQEQQLAVAGFKVLGEAGGPAISELESLLIDSHVKSLAALSLSFVGEPGIAVLLNALRNPEASVRATAACGLAGTRLPLMDVPLALIEALEDEAPGVRTCAALTLGDLKLLPYIAVPALTTTALYDANRNTRYAALRSIGMYGDEGKEALPQVSKLLNDSDEIIRNAARTTIRQISERDGVRNEQ